MADHGELRRDTSGWFPITATGSTPFDAESVAAADRLLVDRLLEVPTGAQTVRLTEKGRLDIGGAR